MALSGIPRWLWWRLEMSRFVLIWARMLPLIWAWFTVYVQLLCMFYVVYESDFNMTVLWSINCEILCSMGIYECVLCGVQACILRVCWIRVVDKCCFMKVWSIIGLFFLVGGGVYILSCCTMRSAVSTHGPPRHFPGAPNNDAQPPHRNLWIPSITCMA